MKKLILALMISLSAVSAFAQENVNTADEAAPANTQAEPEKKAKAPATASDFNKKKLSLDRHDELKWYAVVGYSLVTPENSYGKMFNYRLNIAGGYQFTNFAAAEVFLSYADGKTSVTGESFRGTMYDVGAQAVLRYPFELPVGNIYPYAAIGGSYTFGDVRRSYAGGENKYGLSGGAVHAKVGVRYIYNVLIAGINAGYIYSFTEAGPIDNFSAITYGVELGVKF